MKNYNWEVQSEIDLKDPKTSTESLISELLRNRKIISETEKAEFVYPTNPEEIGFGNLGVKKKDVNTILSRIKKVIKDGEKVVIYGDYDADGICATAILWECLYRYSKNVIPHVPDRFSEGYGINSGSISKLKDQYTDLALIITVDNGIVAHDAVGFANESGIDVIVVDHHEKEKNTPKAIGIIHSVATSGAGLAWMLAKEIDNVYGKFGFRDSLELAAIGIIADQIPLVGVSRSLVKYGVVEIRKTSRPGLNSIIEASSIDKTSIGTYEIGYLIAPRLNAMGRLAHGIESLRLLCTKNSTKAEELSKLLNETNISRQKIVDEVVTTAFKAQSESKTRSKIIVLVDESYHEGVIGLAASKLVEKFYLPSIVISKGEKQSKGSARSISGVNIIELIRQADDLLIAGGGHSMAAGFSIDNNNIEAFIERLCSISDKVVSKDLLEKRLKIDCKIPLSMITSDLVEQIELLEPFGIGNPKPLFVSDDIEILDIRTVGADNKHVKLKIAQGLSHLEVIGFGFGQDLKVLGKKKSYKIAYTVERNSWNGSNRIQLNMRDYK